ncbi:hypothetical protein ACYCI2_14790 [Klebsiella michiganensis]
MRCVILLFVLPAKSCTFYAIFSVRAGNGVKFVKYRLQVCLKREDTSNNG